MRVLQLGERLARVLDSEVRHSGPPAQLAIAAEVRDQRIVRVQGELAGSLERGHQLGPFVGETLELAVAIELIPEEVAENQEARPELRGHARQPGLVELEEPLVA